MKAISATIELLRNSQDSLYTHQSKDEVISSLQAIQNSFEKNGQLDKAVLSLLFGPTGAIQEISIDNGWGYKFLELAQEVDRILTK